MRSIMKSGRGFSSLVGAAVLGASALVASHASASVIYGIDNNNNLFNFNSGTPGNIISGKFITGLAGGERIISIDGRPATSELFAMSTLNKLYTLNPLTGAATAVGSGFAPGLNGNSFGFDFNPTVDRIRVVSDADQNMRLNPVTGGLAGTDTNLAYAAGDINVGKNPSVVGSAYTNSVSSPVPTQTTLYGIDSVNDVLVRQGSVNVSNPLIVGTDESPNTGLLHTVGAGLGFDATNLVGFDIDPADGVAYAALQPNGSATSNLYVINLTTGLATNSGTIIGGVQVADIAIEPGIGFIIPEPGSILSFTAAALALGVRRRQKA